MKHFLFTVLLIGVTASGFTQAEDDDSTLIANYLYNQLDYKQTRISCQLLDSISTAEIYSTQMNFPTGKGGYLPTEYQLLKTNNTFKSIYSSAEVICMPEFIESIQNNYRLNDLQEAIRFQEIIDIVDRWNNLSSDRKIFQKGNDWYFIRDQFFDDFELYIVHTDKKGRIISIEYHSKKEGLEIPIEAEKTNKHRAKWGYKTPALSPDDSVYLRNYFNQTCNFHFEFTRLKSRLIEKITNADFYNAKIVFTQDSFSSATAFSLLKSKDDIAHANSNRELLELPIFSTSLKKDLVIKNKDDALTFQEALDVIAPIGTFDADDKELLLLNGKWYFIRSESFGDKAAFVIETDDNSKIASFSYKNNAIKAKKD